MSWLGKDHYLFIFLFKPIFFLNVIKKSILLLKITHAILQCYMTHKMFIAVFHNEAECTPDRTNEVV